MDDHGGTGREIGLSSDLAAVRRAGARPLLFGAALSATVAVVSLLLQVLMGSA